MRSVALSFAEARRLVVETVRAAPTPKPVEEVALLEAPGRVLAEPLAADRDLPPVARSIRDGFAVRAADLPGELTLVGEVRAGTVFEGAVQSGQAVEIMTGAPLPVGADAVVMLEHAVREGDRVRIERTVEPGEFINPQGAEARRGDVLLCPGTRLGFAQIALAASIGRTKLRVFRLPTVAILPTGDEIVPVEASPEPYQVRNSNAYSLAVQVARAGGRPQRLDVARDDLDETRRLVESGLQADLLLLSGGVSAGKYDVVERVLSDLGAEFYFDRVLIQPGQPLVFGRVGGVFFFGLPGNPASTMVTFELFARAALELLAGVEEPALSFFRVPLAEDFRHRPGLTRFLPARLSSDGRRLRPIPWRGSSDLPAMARANAWLVADAGREYWRAGEPIEVFLP
ncbi:MAG: molybdopterin molybdotransferase MoeA [Bryobacteraceae bacterium]|nr:molybdopterin molybdotransferase MoeA [Bryobacteraceae bacterium]